MTTSGLEARENGRVPATPPKRAERRSFMPEAKLAVIRECDEAEHGQVGAILRKHGATRTNLCDWRRQYHEGGMAALAGKRAQRAAGTDRCYRDLEERNAQLVTELEKFRALVEISGNVYALLGMISESADTRTP
jgi:transposase-like protein